MRILVVDDEPIRAAALVKAGHYVAIAHTIEQVCFWLKHGPWDAIMLDHDLNREYNGHTLCLAYGADYLAFGCPIRIWSLNSSGASSMYRALVDCANEFDIEYQIRVVPFGTLPGDC